MAIHTLQLPVDAATVETLEIGDTVYLTGTVYTARDMAHLEIRKLVDAGRPLPVDLAGRAIFHAGPVVRTTPEGFEMIVVGPTTSIRMEPHAEMVARLGVKLLIGKGGMAEASRAAFKAHKQAYLQAAPGCAVLLAGGVRRVPGRLWPENGMPEAMWTLEVEKFGPFIVTMDSRGNSRYEEVKAKARKKIEQLFP